MTFLYVTAINAR